ncbi:MAG: hypothetical protein KF689_13170 [Gemmatimonadaceae bacterium]|nr:hypothetical protein [Gemmatimonadaceae bacterium]MCW5827065.1 hypothetical protein [Gemmatimonadaceae bacterium]
MRRSFHSVLSLVALVALATVLPRTAVAQADSPLLDAQADSAVAMFRAQGFSLAQQSRGALAASASRDVTLEIPTGKTGIVVAVCDANCSDIDLEVFKGSQSVGSDFEPDDVPIVILENQTGEIRVKVSMATCQGNCGYRLMLFVN